MSGSSYPSRIGSDTERFLKESAFDVMYPIPASINMEELRREYRQDGCFYVNDTVPREDMLNLREKYAFEDSAFKWRVYLSSTKNYIASCWLPRLLRGYFSYLTTNELLKPRFSPRDDIDNPNIAPKSLSLYRLWHVPWE